MHVLRVKNQIKPFQQKSTKAYVPFTVHPCCADACDITDLT